ncbi:MAG: Flp pilus assembly complex ATPase component TadA [Lentisphaeria bacterium]|nr:Flp pilus assembly complex ATPase component TadA [Lentisphaeria bacterium]
MSEEEKLSVTFEDESALVPVNSNLPAKKNDYHLDLETQTLRDILLNAAVCNEEVVNDAIEEHLRTGRSLYEVILDYGIVSESDLNEHIAQGLGTEVIELAELSLDPEVLAMIDGETAHMLGVVPVSFDGSTLYVAARNPFNYQIIDELRFLVKHDVAILVAPIKQIDDTIEKHYQVSLESAQALLTTVGFDETSEDVRDLETAANDAPIVRFVDAIMYQAIKDKASDIHFEPFENEFKIRYRVDGALYELAPPPKNLAIPVISRVKIISELNIAERRKPQDGRIQLKIAGKPIDLRVSTLPTQFGESVVLRVLDRSVVNLDLDVLGIADANLEKIRELIAMPNGIFVITGPTGSGKTTTLYSALKEINKVEVKILTAEDPVEYDLEGIIQLPINDAVGMTFARALRAFLRQDPDIIMLGEIRDLESGEMAIQAALTGHLVFSTLHTNDAAGAITRFVDMGVEPFLIASAVIGVLGQRLIRRVCPKCKTAFDPDDHDLEMLGLKREQIGNNKFYYGKGCPHCNNSGYKGRKALTELLLMSPQISELVLQNAPTVIIREKARELGMATMREDGIKAILNGETTMEEVLRYT